MGTERIVKLQDALDNVENISPTSRQFAMRGEDGTPVLRAVDMNDKNDPEAVFIAHQERILDGYVTDPETIPVPERDSHGRRRNKRERNEIREAKLDYYRFELAVLRGTILAPLTLIQKSVVDDEGSVRTKYVGYSISRKGLDI